MSNTNIEEEIVGETEDTNQSVVAPTKNDLKIRVKFNKEMRELSMDEATALAQKGLKYDFVSKELERLKKLASKGGKNITDFITELENQNKIAHKNKLLEDCLGNEELVERIIKLEGEEIEENLGFEELQNEFPEIESVSSLPAEVLENVEIKGGNLLDAYLRYLHKQTRQAKRYMEEKIKTDQSSTGSQQGFGNTVSNTNEEFIKGLWN